MPIVPVFFGCPKTYPPPKINYLPESSSALRDFVRVLGLGTWFLEWVFFFAFLSLLCKILMFASSPLFLIHIYIGVKNHLQKNALLPESELASSGHVLVT